MADEPLPNALLHGVQLLEGLLEQLQGFQARVAPHLPTEGKKKIS